MADEIETIPGSHQRANGKWVPRIIMRKHEAGQVFDIPQEWPNQEFASQSEANNFAIRQARAYLAANSGATPRLMWCPQCKHAASLFGDEEEKCSDCGTALEAVPPYQVQITGK
jgi:hypothetical protein